jgi:hypothetical protein
MAEPESPPFIDARLVLRTALIAAAVQLVLEGAGHVVPALAGNRLLFGHMMVSATAGYLYGLIFGRGYVAGAVGGAIAGGLCAVPALVLGGVLRDVEGLVVATGTAVSVFTGAVGGAFGQMGAILKKLGF